LYRPLPLLLAIVAAASLTVVPALVQGRLVHRWGTPPDMSAAAQQLAKFPRSIDDWDVSQDGEPLSEGICRELGLVGHVSRVYKNRSTGDVVTLLLMLGQSGRLVRHPPDICYANRANEQVGEATTMSVDTTTPPSEFRLLEYRKNSLAGDDSFQVAYGLTTDTTWSAPKYPRIAFGGSPHVYKVQLLTSLETGEERADGQAVLQAFAERFCDVFSDLSTPATADTDSKVL
jgi:hypothetical protein